MPGGPHWVDLTPGLLTPWLLLIALILWWSC